MTSPNLPQKQFAMGVKSYGGKLELMEFHPAPLKDDEVLIAVQYCGMCHSDIHMADNSWKKEAKLPLVPGHEGVGKVAAVGPRVTTVRVGDTVGFGPTAGSCGDCELCRKGIEQSCDKMEEVYNPKWGGYATTVTVHDRFAFKIPDGMPLHATAPLLCAGVTTYAPLARNVKRGDKVGIVGIGGLGHLALQFSAAMGCEVWALSRTPDKEPDAHKLGASRFLLISDKDGLKAQEKSFDFLMCCSSDHFDLDTFMALLKPRASFCLVGLPAVEPPLQFNPFSLVAMECNMVGSHVGGVEDTKAMLAFAAEHKILPEVQVIDFNDANQGFEAMRKNNMRFRTVLKIEGFAERHAAGGGSAGREGVGSAGR